MLPALATFATPFVLAYGAFQNYEALASVPGDHPVRGFLLVETAGHGLLIVMWICAFISLVRQQGISPNLHRGMPGDGRFQCC